MRFKLILKMNVEKLCLQEACHLVTKSPKYWQLVFKVYLSTLRNALSAKVFRASYFFCRHIDDVLDGDRSVSGDPEDYVQSILSAMHSGQGGPEIVGLYRFAIGHLADMAKEGEDPARHFKRVIKDAMLFDYERAKNHRVLTVQELEQYYDDTFAPVMNLALMIAGSSQRSADLPESVSTQGHIYTIRDLEADLAQGIINIPAEELAKSNIDVHRPFGKDAVVADANLSRWISDEVSTHHRKLGFWKLRLADEGAKNVCLPLIWQMDIFCRLHKLGLV